MEKSFEELEKEVGYHAIDPSKWPKKLTAEAFFKLAFDNPIDFVGINYEDRIGFLQKNGYEVSRQSLLDSSLSARTPE